MLAIAAGSLVRVRTASGEWVDRRAVSGVVDGYDFSVVWVSTEQEWNEARGTGREPEALPWPAADVIPRENTNNTP